jgi:hypothetical protein
MSKSGNSSYFRHVFANNFFGTCFKNFFNGFEISVKFCVFRYLFNLKKKNFLGHISSFSNFEAKRAKNCSKKRKTFFYKHA